MAEEEILKLIGFLIGNITPIGDEAADEVAMQNIEKLISIMKELHLKIDEIAFNKPLLHRLYMSNLTSFLSLYISFFSVSSVRKEVL